MLQWLSHTLLTLYVNVYLFGYWLLLLVGTPLVISTWYFGWPFKWDFTKGSTRGTLVHEL